MELHERIASGAARVAVVGLGHIGMPLAHTLVHAGLRVTGYDDRRVIDGLAHPDDAQARFLSRSELYEDSSDTDRLGSADVIVICAPTPLGLHREPDLHHILDVARDIGRTLRPGQLVVLESTTFPGTTRGELLPAILDARPDDAEPLLCGRDFFMAYSPEREDPGRTTHDTASTPKLVGGLDPLSTALAATFYRRCVAEVVVVRSAEVAEAAKLHENIFRAVNVALVNEMKIVLAELGIDVWEVIRAASTKPFGFMPFYPGPGLGGHCVPVDPFYLTWRARAAGQFVRFIELAGVVNAEMPHYVLQEVAAALNRGRKTINGARILVLGIAYKANVADTRESPALELMAALEDLGAEVEYSDPHVPVAPATDEHAPVRSSVELTPQTVAACDAVLIVTDHDGFDYGLVAEHAALVIDTRDAMRDHAQELGDRLVKA